MVECSVDLWSILVELLLIVLIEVMKVDRVWAEDEVIERGDANVLVHSTFINRVNIIFQKIQYFDIIYL